MTVLHEWESFVGVGMDANTGAYREETQYRCKNCGLISRENPNYQSWNTIAEMKLNEGKFACGTRQVEQVMES